MHGTLTLMNAFFSFGRAKKILELISTCPFYVLISQFHLHMTELKADRLTTESEDLV